MRSSSALTQLLGIDAPIIQAPIGSLATVELVAEVARAGGIGGLALTWSSPDVAVAQVKELKRKASKCFFVNYVLRFPLPSLDAVLSEGVPAVTLSWGIDAALIARIKSMGAVVAVQIGHPQGAKMAAAAGADIIIAQGFEAGGHVQSTLPLATLLSSLRAIDLQIPIVAAGGLATPADIVAVLRAGADAAMLGTRFIATREANAHPAYKQALIDARAGSTAFTNCYDIDWPYAMVRVLRNSTLDAWEAAGCPSAPNRPGEGDVVATQDGRAIIRYSDTPPNGNAVGDALAACVYAGTGVDDIDDIPPAFELVRELCPQN